MFYEPQKNIHVVALYEEYNIFCVKKYHKLINQPVTHQQEDAKCSP